MNLRDLIYKKDNIKRKISELEAIIVEYSNDDIAKELFNLIEELQSLKINLNNINIKAKINIGGKNVSIADAIIIRETLETKMNVLTRLILSDKVKALDELELMVQRDGLYESYLLLDQGIISSDLQTIVSV